ncbi:FAD-dependent oxidoreductase [Leucobacter sp. USHLN153]|uniref:FAD-dependent oxidoreductase n=1 Tax=Leucobacter sp. USHLN153 TaxID=3081268 RepID=UPI00301AEAC3
MSAQSEEVEVDVDVVIVGAGAGGLTAALAVADAGHSVVVLEKLESPGGNSSLSTGSIPAAGTKQQRELGVDDRPDLMAEDLLRQSGPHEAEHLTRRLADTSAELVDWLIDTHQVELKLITDYKHVGHSVTRLHAPASRRGADLISDLLAACERAGVDVLVGNPVGKLLVEEGEVRGVVVEGDRAGTYELRSNAVILASNGFGGNAELLRKWIPEIADVEYFGAHGSTGEAIEWAVELGGHLQNRGAYQGYAAVAYPHGSILSWTTVEKGGVLVDSTGRRLGDEIVGYSGFTSEVLGGAAPIYVVYDARIKAIAEKEEEFAELVKMNGATEYATVQELAAGIGVDVDALSSTLQTYAEAAAGTAPDPFGRTDFGIAPLEAPFVASRVTPGLFHTQGGVAVDDDGRVLAQDGTPVPRLFAVGGVAAGVSGLEGGRGYSSGNGLLTAAGLGRLAGIAAGELV